MNPISPTTLDNLSMDLKEKKYHEGLNFDDEISNPSPSIGPKTPKSSKQRYSSFSSPSVGAFTDIYSQAPKAQRSPKKSILSPTKNYSELVNRLRAARGSPVKTENKVTDSGKYKWSPTSRINSLEEEMSKLHRDAEKNEIYRKENLRLQKEMEKLESVKLDCAQAQKDASYWKTEIEYLKQESSRLKEESSRLKEENTRLQTTLDSKDSKLDHLQIENEKLTKHKTMQASIIAKRDTKIAELRKSLNLSIAYSDKWCEMIDSMAVEIRKLKQHIRDLKGKETREKQHNLRSHFDGEFANTRAPMGKTRSGGNEGLSQASRESELDSRALDVERIRELFEEVISEKLPSLMRSQIGVEATPQGTFGAEQRTKSQNINQSSSKAQDLADALHKQYSDHNLMPDNVTRNEGVSGSKDQNGAFAVRFNKDLLVHENTLKAKGYDSDHNQQNYPHTDGTPAQNLKVIETLLNDINELKNKARAWEKSQENGEKLAGSGESTDPVIHSKTKSQLQYRERHHPPRTNFKSDDKYGLMGQVSQPQQCHHEQLPNHKGPHINVQTQTDSTPSTNDSENDRYYRQHDGSKTNDRRASFEKSTQTYAAPPFEAQVGAERGGTVQESTVISIKEGLKSNSDPRILPTYSNGDQDSIPEHLQFCSGVDDLEITCLCTKCLANRDYTNSNRGWVTEIESKPTLMTPAN